MSTKFFGAQTEDELRFSPMAVGFALALLGFMAVLASDALSDLDSRFRLLGFGMLCYAGVGLLWLLPRWHHDLTRWTAALLPALLVPFGVAWLHMPALLILSALPVVIAMGLVGFQRVTIVAAVESIGILLAAMAAPWLERPAILLALAAIWGTFGLLFGLYRLMLRLTNWSWRNYRQVLLLLEEARDRKAELEQVLEELVHTNRQMDLLNERLAAARLAAEEAQKAKAAFVAKVSHEFRTPLNMIIGLTDLAVESPDLYGAPLPPALQEDLHIVHRNCAHLANMVNDVLDLSQAESGRLALRREWVDLGTEIVAAATVVQPLVDKKGLELRVQCSPELPSVYCDRTRIRQVILNLVSNAARYTEQGWIQVTAEAAAHSVTISVEDTGPGIPAGEAARLFEPFYQGTVGVWQEHNGSGLGLTISRQFIEQHGGQIWVESEVGYGSRFVFRLPVFPPDAPVSGSGRWLAEDFMWRDRSTRPRTPRPPYRRRLIVWDQTDDLLPSLAEHSEHVECVAAHSLEETLAALDDCPAHAILVNAASPELVLPMVDHVRAIVDDTPVLGYCLPEQHDEANAAGALAYLTKPITRADLRAVLQAAGQPQAALIVDDDPDFRRLLGRMLHTLAPSLQVREAGDGESALQMMRGDVPDLLFLDINMPNLDGWQLLAAKNQDPMLNDLPAVIVSAQDPVDEPAQSGLLVAALGEGIALSKLLPCSLALAELLLNPEPTPDRALESSPDGAPVWTHSPPRPEPAPTPPGVPPSR